MSQDSNVSGMFGYRGGAAGRKHVTLVSLPVSGKLAKS
jgi:hypothetical protein